MSGIEEQTFVKPSRVCIKVSYKIYKPLRIDIIFVPFQFRNYKQKYPNKICRSFKNHSIDT